MEEEKKDVCKKDCNCEDCRNIVSKYGKTVEEAWNFNHGNDDEKFGVFFVMLC